MGVTSIGIMFVYMTWIQTASFGTLNSRPTSLKEVPPLSLDQTERSILELMDQSAIGSERSPDAANANSLFHFQTTTSLYSSKEKRNRRRKKKKRRRRRRKQKRAKQRTLDERDFGNSIEINSKLSTEDQEMFIPMYNTSLGYPKLNIPTSLNYSAPAEPIGYIPRDPQKILKSSRKALVVTKKEYLKSDWCKTEPLRQKIRMKGCLSKTVINRFCYGQCNSFYIPRNAKRSIETTAFKSCAFCKPNKYSWVVITLRCPGMNPPLQKKKVQRIVKCKCITEVLE